MVDLSKINKTSKTMWLENLNKTIIRRPRSQFPLTSLRRNVMLPRRVPEIAADCNRIVQRKREKDHALFNDDFNNRRACNRRRMLDEGSAAGSLQGAGNEDSEQSRAIGSGSRATWQYDAC